MWRIPHVAEPDLLVFDLDPGAPATIVECCAVALWLRPLLAEAGFDAFAKTSGGKGLQLLAPLTGTSSDGASAMARTIAEHLEREQPAAVVSRMTRSLRPGKVLVDWSQNNAHKTTIAPYSLRARGRPTVSTPVTWDEVAGCERPEDLVFTSGEVLDRVAGHGDLLAPLVGAQPGPSARPRS
jgi:bifunctional non-homologous end joining protein LigD